MVWADVLEQVVYWRQIQQCEGWGDWIVVKDKSWGDWIVVKDKM